MKSFSPLTALHRSPLPPLSTLRRSPLSTLHSPLSTTLHSRDASDLRTKSMFQHILGRFFFSFVNTIKKPKRKKINIFYLSIEKQQCEKNDLVPSLITGFCKKKNSPKKIESFVILQARNNGKFFFEAQRSISFWEEMQN